ncbi:hypothetical protein V5799_015274 [Amblyomma americanum]|uniref:Uncharacterized protein n=1 Tax=Amblyomma americanum TaxID=6943 RepID=A0AAQ4E0M1_AMBAM
MSAGLLLPGRRPQALPGQQRASVRRLLQPLPPRGMDPGARQLHKDIVRLAMVLQGSGLMPGARPSELREVYLESIAAHTASCMARLHSPVASEAVGDDAVHSGGERELFWGFPPEQLFFYLHCFSQCGRMGRAL